MRRPVRKHLQVNPPSTTIVDRDHPDTTNTKPQISQIYADYAQGRTGKVV